MEELTLTQKIITIGIICIMLLAIIKFLTGTYLAFVNYDAYKEAGLVVGD